MFADEALVLAWWPTCKMVWTSLFMTIVSSQWRDKSLPPFMEPLALQSHPFPRFHHVRPTRIDSQKSTVAMSPSSCPKYNPFVTDNRRTKRQRPNGRQYIAHRSDSYSNVRSDKRPNPIRHKSFRYLSGRLGSFSF